MQTAADVMSSPVETVSADATVASALDVMRSRGVSSLLVVACEPGEPPGFFSQADAMTRVVAPGIDPASVRVRDVMSSPVISVSPETPLQECARLMSRVQIRRLLVHDGVSFAGIVSTSDVLHMNNGRPAHP